MPPKSSQRFKASQPSPQAVTLANAVESFCKEIRDQKKVNVQIKTPLSLNPLIESIRVHRRRGTKINSTLIKDIVDELDNLCSRIDPTAFSIVIQLILQAEDCRDGERGIQLLTASLFQDSHKLTNQRALEKRKDLIGKECFQPLLSYFIDTENDVRMRRWVGVLCSQLLNGSEQNQHNLELGSDDLRQKIGPLMVEETNEIIRVICGQLVRDLVKAGLALEGLFPINYDSKLYEGFPTSSQSEKVWASLFDIYVDDVFAATGKPQGPGEFHFASGFNLDPPFEFGAADKNVYILVEGGEMSVMAPSSEKHMQHILDIPLHAINHMTILVEQHSQAKDFGDVMIDLKNERNIFCYLDAVAMKVAQIHLSTWTKSITALKEVFITASPGFRVTEQDNDQSPAGPDDDETPRNTLTSGAEDNITTQSSQQMNQIDGKSQLQEPIGLDRYGEQESQSASGADLKGMHNTQPLSDGIQDSPQNHQDQDTDFVRPNEDEDPSPPTNKPAQATAISETAKSTTVKEVAPKKRQGVKPKAKAPIMVNQQKAKSKESERQAAPAATVSRSQKNPGESSSLHAMKKSVTSIQPRKTINSSYHLTRPKSTLVDDDIQNSQPVQTNKPTTVTSRSSTKVPAKASQPKKTADFEDDDNIITPGENDASKPKAKADKPSKKAVAEAAKATKSGNQQLKADLSGVAVNQPKKYGLYQKKLDNNNANANSKDGNKDSNKDNKKNNTKVASSGNVFDTPDDDEEDVPTTQAGKKAKSTAKVTTTLRKSTGKIANKVVATTTAKADARKKRQSAPAKLLKAAAPIRNSQRVAAAAAAAKIQGADDTDDELEVERDDPEALKATKNPIKKAMEPEAPKAPKNLTKKATAIDKADKSQLDTQKSETKGKETKFTEPLDTPEEGEELLQLQREDAIALGFRKEDTVIPSQVANPKVKSALLQIEPHWLKSSKQMKLDNENAKTKTAAIKMANKLDTLLDLVEDSDVQMQSSPQMAKPQEPEDAAMQHISGDAKPALDPESSPPAELDQPVGAAKHATVKQSAYKSQSQKHTKVKAAEQEDQPNDVGGDAPADYKSQSQKVQGTKIVEQEERPHDAQEDALVLQEKKRKSTGEDGVPPKKRRSTEITHETGQSPSRTSHQQLPKSQQQPLPKISKRASQVPVHNSPGPGPSTVIPSDQETSEPELVDDYLARKQQLISFDAKGPRNQGLSSTHKRSVSRSRELHAPKEQMLPVGDQLLDLKRKRDKSELVDTQSPENRLPRKRLSVSPLQDYIYNSGGDGPQIINSSPPKKASDGSSPQAYDEISSGGAGEQILSSSPPVPVSDLTTQRLRAKRQSSQSSRVDINGSPIAPPSMRKVDHISKLKKKLSADSGQLRMEPPQAEVSEEKIEKKPRRLSEIFGPKVSLGSQPKARPSSPSGVPDRYVAHKKTGKGHYEEVSTKEVVEEQKTLADPFQDEGRKPSNFTERLRDDGAKHRESKRHSKETPLEEVQEKVIEEVKLPKVPRGSLLEQAKTAQTRQVRKTTHRAPLEDEDRTLVNNEKGRHMYQRSLPSDMTSGSTQVSSEPSRTPLGERVTRNDVWNVAIRPHYSGLSDAVHRIADEVIIRLAGEEDKMGLLVENYNETGSRVLANFESKREQEKATVIKKLDRKKKEMLGVYNRSKEFVQKNAQDSVETSVASFEKEWRKQQALAQKKILEGMDMLE